jgi:hypothetical protein
MHDFTKLVAMGEPTKCTCMYEASVLYTVIPSFLSFMPMPMDRSYANFESFGNKSNSE